MSGSDPKACPALSRPMHALAAAPAGALFLIAGAAKIADLPSVATTIQTITSAPAGISTLLAVLLAAAETTGGMLLLLGVRPRLAALGLAALVAIFLLAPLVLPLPEHCACFGALTPEMGARSRTALDCALLALLMLVALSGHPRPVRWSVPLALCLAALLRLVFAQHPLPDLSRALDHAASADTLFARAPGKRALLLLNVEDFLCPPCYQDIRQTIDTLSRFELLSPGHRALILLRSRRWSAEMAAARAQRWQRAGQISLPTSAIADSLLEIGRQSAVAVIDERGTVVFLENFPLGDGLRHQLLQLLSPAPRG